MFSPSPKRAQVSITTTLLVTRTVLEETVIGPPILCWFIETQHVAIKTPQGCNLIRNNKLITLVLIFSVKAMEISAFTC